jgi:hypothetical protein
MMEQSAFPASLAAKSFLTADAAEKISLCQPRLTGLIDPVNGIEG